MDVAARAEVPLDSSREFMPMSMHFRIGNVVSNPELRARCRDVVVAAHKRGELPSYYGPGIGFRFAEDEIDVHAIRITADATDPEALTRAERFLDESLLTDQRVIRFIHGYGTGQLKRALAGFLQQHPLVARFATAPPNQGGGGVTVVELKD